MGRPKGSKTNIDGRRNRVLAKAAKFWEKKFDEATTDAEREIAAEHLTKIGISQNSLKKSAVIHSDKKKIVEPEEYNPATDPEPEHAVNCGHLTCAPGCKWDAWDDRQRAYRAAHPELALKPEPVPEPTPVVFVEPEPTFIMEEADEEPIAVKPAPVPKIKPRPVPAPVVRTECEGHSGKFYREVFWDLSLFERNCLLKTLNPAQRSEWNMIVEKTTLPPPQPVRVTLTEAEKRQAFSSPSVLPKDEAFATGQPQTVDEVRKTFAPTMGNANPDSGISVPLDRRTWMPDLNPLIHK
jgi:hypothetical protein